nr:Methyltransferase domain protein [uncultured bacterium]
MYNSFQLAKKYLHYYLNASNSKGHGMHSPFVFDFILNVLNNKSNYQYPDDIEALRKSLLNDERVIEVEDLGAGSRLGSSKRKSIATLARTALKPEKYARLLYRLVKHYQPKTIVELGTSLGITTAYFSKANSSASIITVEGSRNIHQAANENFKNLNCTNIQSLQGNFDEILPALIPDLTSPVSLAYIDGNHRYEPTIKYFREFLHISDEDTIMVFDDIHWSRDMEAAWEEIKADPKVQYSIDIFFMGFIFFRKEFKVKQDFNIRF